MKEPEDPKKTPSHLVVRVRLGIDFKPDRLVPHEFLEAVAHRLERLCQEMGTELDVLQVGVAGDPRWQGLGPDNRVVGRPLRYNQERDGGADRSDSSHVGVESGPR